MSTPFFTKCGTRPLTSPQGGGRFRRLVYPVASRWMASRGGATPNADKNRDLGDRESRTLERPDEAELPGECESRVRYRKKVRRKGVEPRQETPMTEGFAALALHRPSRPENIGGVLRAPDVYGVKLVVLGGGALPPEPLGHPTDTTQAWRRIPLEFADDVFDALPKECVPIAVERVVEATPLPEFEHPESAAYLFGPENGSLDDTILARCTHVVFLPGHECSNLAAGGQRGALRPHREAVGARARCVSAHRRTAAWGSRRLRGAPRPRRRLSANVRARHVGGHVGSASRKVNRARARARRRARCERVSGAPRDARAPPRGRAARIVWDPSG